MADLLAARRLAKTLAAVVIMGALLAAGCSKSKENTGAAPQPAATEASPSQPPPPPAPVTITYTNQAIDQPAVNVAVGTKVVWKNAETNGVPHNVTSGTVQGTTPQPDGKFGSASLFNPGQTFEHTFTAPGTYRYYCSVHLAQMQGTITVG